MDALYIAATGMQAQQMAVDTVANNLANVQTPGFKRSSVSFQELMYREVAAAGLPTSPSGSMIGIGTENGFGVAATNHAKVFVQGDLKQTGSPLDLAIRGSGLIEVVLPDGTTGYTRGGSLKVGKDGVITTAAGYALKQSLNVPQDTEEILISPQGSVSVRSARQTSSVEIGQIELVRFLNPDSLSPLGDGLYRRTDLTSEPMFGKPGEDDLGLLAQGFVEGSNVKMIDEMIALVVAQRAYESNSKVVQASDDIMGMVNGLRR